MKIQEALRFSSNNISKFILLLRKSLYPYKYIVEWGRFNETSLRENDDFYRNLNMDDIPDSD